MGIVPGNILGMRPLFPLDDAYETSLHNWYCSRFRSGLYIDAYT